MPRDYKHRAQSRRHRQPSPVAWFLAGLLAGAAGTGLVWLKWGQGTTAAVVTAPAPAPVEDVPERRPPPGAQPPRFEYYSVLPEMEVVIPPEELRPKKAPAAPPVPAAQSTLMPELPGRPAETAAAATPGAGGEPVYLLQLGSFRATGDADRLKASLALIGITARVEKVTIDDKGTYYRVRSGPYTKEQAYGLHRRLEKNRVDSLIVRSRG